VRAVRRQPKVLHQVDLDSVSLANRYGGRDVEKTIKNLSGTASKLGSSAIKGFFELSLRNSSEETEGDRNPKDLEVVVVDLVLKASVTELVEALELVEVNGISIGHDETMERYGHARLAKALDGRRSSDAFRAGWNEDTLPIVRVNVIGHHGDDRASESAIQAIHKGGIDYRAFKQGVFLRGDPVP